MTGLAKECSSWGLPTVRQPGEYRNLRVGHSVGDENLLSLAVVADGSGITDHQTDGILWPSTNRSKRSNIPTRGYRIHRYGRCSHTCDVEFSKFGVERNSRRILDTRMRSFDEAGRCGIALIACLEHQDRIIGIVGHEQFLAVLIERHVRRPIHQRLRALDHARRLDVALAVHRVNGDRRRIELSIPSTTPADADIRVAEVADVDHAVLGVERKAMRIFQTGIVTADIAQRFFSATGLLAVNGD